MKDIGQLYALNRGLISSQALARLDVERVRLSAETMENWMPRVFGAMMLRPGTEHVSTLAAGESYFLPFIFSTLDTSLIEFRNLTMRVLVDEVAVTRTAVSSAFTNGTFDSNLSNWSDDDESGATSAWATGGYMELVGNGFAEARRGQQVTVAGGDQNVLHGLRVKVHRNEVEIRVGTTLGAIDYFCATLGVGEHSLAFTPVGNFHVQFANHTKYGALVDSIEIESGAVSFTSPYATADLFKIRYDQSADVVYLACDGYQQYKIERRGPTSYSLVKYQPPNGPFLPLNNDRTTMAVGATSGDTTITASRNYFTAAHVGSLLKVESAGQKVEQTVTAENQFTGDIRVTGVGTTRNVEVVITGTFTATVTLQRSLGESGSWTDVTTYTTATTVTYNDTLDNNIAFYRIGVKTGDYTSGTADCSLEFSGGSITGIARIDAFTSATVVDASVLTEFGGTAATEIWYQGAWGAGRGYPTAVALAEGRLGWAGRENVWLSVSDSYENFDDEIEGATGPISRTIGRGAVDNIRWMLAMQRLILGTDGGELSVRTSTFDEPLAPGNFSIKAASTQGTADVAAVTVDTRAMMVQRSTYKVYELAYSSDGFDYDAEDVTSIVPEIGNPGIIFMAVQRQPDTRVHCVLSDGTVAILIWDRIEEVRAWIKVSAGGSGLVEQVVVLPGTAEDKVYYLVNRSGTRYLERWALESQCQGGSLNRCLDAHVTYSGTAETSITGLSHLEGLTVAAWADGQDVGTFTVTSGAITLSTAASNVVVGLPYTAQFLSTKLQFATEVPLTQKKRIDHIGLVLGPTHRQGLQVGQDLTTMVNLPLIEAGKEVTTDWTAYDQPSFPINGKWDTDARVALKATGPRHATVLGVVVNINAHEKA